MIELEDCPMCGGPSLLEEENNGFYVSCLDCGSQSAISHYKNEEGRLAAAKTTAELWNMGKVIFTGRSE